MGLGFKRGSAGIKKQPAPEVTRAEREIIMKVYANIIKGNGVVIRTKLIGTCYLPNSEMSYRKYRELQRAAYKAFPNVKKGQNIEIILENGFVSLNRT